MTTSGFYKSDLTHAPNWVISPNFQLLRSAKDSYTYPVEGWYWFDSLELACEFFNVPVPTEFNQGTEFIPTTNAPDWDGFNFWLFSNVDFVNYVLSINSTNPLAIPALITQYSKVAEYGASQFKPYFDLFCSLTQVAVEHRQEWAIAAEGFNLPIEFLEVLRGG